MGHSSPWQQDCVVEAVHMVAEWKHRAEKETGAAITFKDMPPRMYLLQLDSASSSPTASQSCANKYSKHMLTRDSEDSEHPMMWNMVCDQNLDSGQACPPGSCC